MSSVDADNETGTDQDALVAYLQAPKKKRKNHVVIAMRRGFQQERINLVTNYVRKNYPQLEIDIITDRKKLARLFGRQVCLVLFDDFFDEDEEALFLVETLKSKKMDEQIPVIFFTENPEELRNKYGSTIQKTSNDDDYFHITTMQNPELLGKVKLSLDKKLEKRKTPAVHKEKVRIDQVRSETQLEGMISEVTVYGASLECSHGVKFRVGDQVRLTVPVQNRFSINEGEYFYLSARVDRVYITGNTVVLRWFQLSTKKRGYITKYITSVYPEKQVA